MVAAAVFGFWVAWGVERSSNDEGREPTDKQTKDKCRYLSVAVLLLELGKDVERMVPIHWFWQWLSTNQTQNTNQKH